MLSLVVPVHNALPHLTRMLDDLRETEATDHPIVFVDDASAEDVRGPILRYLKDHPQAGLLRNDRQQLFTRTANRGIRACQPDTTIYGILNTDLRLTRGFLDHALATLQEGVGIVGYEDGTPGDGGPYDVSTPDYVTGHCFFVRREVFERVGLFCETDREQAHIASERLLCNRANEAGFRTLYLGKPLVIHDSGGPSWGRNLNWLGAFPFDQLWPGKDSL